MRAPEGIINYIKGQIRKTAEDVLDKIAITDIDPIETYRELLGNDLAFNAFKTAARYLSRRHMHLDYITVEHIGINIVLRAQPDMQQYLLPDDGFKLTPESKLAQALQIPFKVAADWQATITAFDAFSDYDARIVGMFFPWVKDILLDCLWFSGGSEWERSNFKTNWSLTRVNDKVIDQAMAQLIEGKPQRYPALTPLVNSTCTYLGKQLFTQARLLNSPSRENFQAKITAILGDRLLSTQFCREIQEIKHAWEDENDARDLQREARKYKC